MGNSPYMGELNYIRITISMIKGGFTYLISIPTEALGESYYTAVEHRRGFLQPLTVSPQYNLRFICLILFTANQSCFTA
jgi:hypothetical protein